MHADAEQRRDDAEAGGIDRWVAPFFRDSTLWPVAIAAVASLVTLGAALMLLAVQDRNLFAIGAVGVLALVSLEVLVRSARRRRLGLEGRAVLGWWILSAAAAAAGIHGGLF